MVKEIRNNSVRPSVSVLMSVYNGEKYLRRSIESILTQTLKNFEFIIVDDGSTDGSWPIMQELAYEDPRIVLLSNGENLGLIKSLNRGISVARGRYIARHDADDESYPKRLVKQVSFLDQNTEIIAVGSQMLVVNASGRPLRLWKTPLDHESIDFRYINGFGGVIPHPTLMVRAELIRNIGGYREGFFAAEDLDLLLRLSEMGKLANLTDVLVRYRVHGQNITTLEIEKVKSSAIKAVYQAWERRKLGIPPFATVPNPKIKLREGSRAISLMIYGIGNILSNPSSSEGWSSLKSSILKLSGIK